MPYHCDEGVVHKKKKHLSVLYLFNKAGTCNQILPLLATICNCASMPPKIECTITAVRNIIFVYQSVCVCVCVRERETKRERIFQRGLSVCVCVFRVREREKYRKNITKRFVHVITVWLSRWASGAADHGVPPTGQPERISSQAPRGDGTESALCPADMPGEPQPLW